MKKIILPLIFFSGIQMVKAQAVDSRIDKAVLAQPKGLKVKTVEAEKSEYYGFDNKIKSMMADNQIPQKFPTRENYADKNAYLSVANEWIKAHQSLIREEYKNTLLKD